MARLMHRVSPTSGQERRNNMTIAKATGAPLEITVDGEKFRFSPMTDKDFGEFENWVQFKVVQSAVSLLDISPPEYREGILQDAYARAAKVSLADPASSAFMGTIGGGVKLLYLSLRHEHKDIEEDKVKTLMLNPEFSKQMLAALDWINRLSSDESTVPNVRRRKTRRKAKPKKKKKRR